MTPKISSFNKIQEIVDQMDASFRGFVGSLLNLATYNPEFNSYVIALPSEIYEDLRRIANGGSIQVPGATGVPGAPTTVPHQTPAPHGDKADDGRSG